TSNYTFGAKDAGNVLDKKTVESLRKNIDQFGSIKMNNYFFHNNADLTFNNTTKQTGLAVPSISNGAVYADLDNDGDLDLVVNNINQEALVRRNELRKTAEDTTQNFITVQLKGAQGNASGLGSKITVFNKQTQQY